MRTAILSDTRARAALAARRYGVPPTMIVQAARRRAVGDWRGACEAADVDVCVNPGAVRRRYGAEAAAGLVAALRELAPDLLRWHLPRQGHGAGELLSGLYVPLAEIVGGGSELPVLSLVALTPQLALDAGQRIVLTVVTAGARPRPVVDGDPVARTLLEAVHVKQGGRHSLVRNAAFWNAVRAPALAAWRDAGEPAREVVRLQDAGEFAEAWRLAGIVLDLGGALPSRLRWLRSLPVLLPGLAERVRDALPGVDEAVLRSGPGALSLSGLMSGGPVTAHAVPHRAGQGLPTIPTVAWARPTDGELLRHGLIGTRELHPLVASALAPASPAAVLEPDEWLYREVPFIDGPCSDADVPTLRIRCGASAHRVARVDGTWRPVDHGGNPGRESLIHRLGGPTNPCQQATTYLASGRHVIDLAESLLEHGRAAQVRHLLRTHADAHAVLDRFTLPAGGTVGEVLATLRWNTLRLRMLLAGATRDRDTDGYRKALLPTRRRTRKGVPARTPR